MAFRILPKDVADAFVKQYYKNLNKCPENTHKFYQESSFMAWPDPDGDTTPVTTLNGINEKVMSSNYKYCSAEVITVDAQDSSNEGVLIAVSGYLTTPSEEKKSFNQIFFLAKQEKGFYVLNDILRCTDVVETVSNNGSNDDDKNDDCAAPLKTLEPEVSAACEAAAPESTVEKRASVGKLEEEKTVVKVEAPKVSYASVVAKVAPLTSPKASMAASDAPNQQPNGLKKSYSSSTDSAAKASVTKASVSPTREPKVSQAAKNGPSNPSVKPEVKGIYIGGLPYDITKQGIVDAVKKFGPVKNNVDTIQIRRHEDGFCCGFVEFEAADAAHRAVAAHYAMFGEKEAYITYKRSTYSRNNEGRGRSPPRSMPQNGEKNRRGGNSKGQAKAIKALTVQTEEPGSWRIVGRVKPRLTAAAD